MAAFIGLTNVSHLFNSAPDRASTAATCWQNCRQNAFVPQLFRATTALIEALTRSDYSLSTPQAVDLFRRGKSGCSWMLYDIGRAARSPRPTANRLGASHRPRSVFVALRYALNSTVLQRDPPRYRWLSLSLFNAAPRSGRNLGVIAAESRLQRFEAGDGRDFIQNPLVFRRDDFPFPIFKEVS